MTDQDMNRLRVLLLAESEIYVKQPHITDAFIRLNEDTTYSQTTEAELGIRDQS